MSTAAAVELVDRFGLAVFPLPAGGRRPTGPWRAHCFTDPRRVRESWCEADNVGVACRASRVVVLDLDGAEGITTFAELCEHHRQAEPETLAVRTPRGGRHLYFRVEQASTLPSTSGGTSGLGPAIDTRSPGRRYGGYVVGPGSVVSAGRYEISAPHPIRALPDWIEQLLTASAERRQAAAYSPRSSSPRLVMLSPRVRSIEARRPGSASQGSASSAASSNSIT